MSKSATISARIDPDTKREAEAVFRDLGLSASQAITLFYRQVQLQRGLPFEVKVPTETTRQALRQAEARRDLATFDSVEALFEDLNDG